MVCTHVTGSHTRLVNHRTSFNNKKLNSQTINSGHKHCRHFIVLVHKHGAGDVMWKPPIASCFIPDEALLIIYTCSKLISFYKMLRFFRFHDRFEAGENLEELGAEPDVTDRLMQCKHTDVPAHDLKAKYQGLGASSFLMGFRSTHQLVNCCQVIV